jgi:uncharacterized phiE125 gp8 family phage protein
VSWARCCCPADAAGASSAAPDMPEAPGIVVSDPAVAVVEPITVDEAKHHCRVDIADDDALIALYIAAARTLVENVTEQMFVAQGFIGRYHVVAASAPIELGRWPVEAVTAVEKIPADGTAASAITGWSLDGLFGILYAPPEGWPVGPDNVRVKFTGGPAPAGADPVPVPADIHKSILSLVSQYYDTRAPVSLAGSPASMPHDLERVLAFYARSTGVVTL